MSIRRPLLILALTYAADSAASPGYFTQDSSNLPLYVYTADQTKDPTASVPPSTDTTARASNEQ
jgi:hypothetical protein